VSVIAWHGLVDRPVPPSAIQKRGTRRFRYYIGLLGILLVSVVHMVWQVMPGVLKNNSIRAKFCARRRMPRPW
jgi:hypothetical protein